MYMQLSPHRMSVPPPAARYPDSHRSSGSEPRVAASQAVGRQAAVGIVSLALLLFAFVSPAGLRVALASAGLLGVMGVRLAAADQGWARRGTAWSTGHTQQSP